MFKQNDWTLPWIRSKCLKSNTLILYCKSSLFINLHSAMIKWNWWNYWIIVLFCFQWWLCLRWIQNILVTFFPCHPLGWNLNFRLANQPIIFKISADEVIKSSYANMLLSQTTIPASPDVPEILSPKIDSLHVLMWQEIF